MARFALVCPPYPSHQRVMDALAQQLTARGHTALQIRFQGSASRTPPPSTDSVLIEDRASQSGVVPAGANRFKSFKIAHMAQTVTGLAQRTDLVCREAPDLLTRQRIDVVLGDQMEAGAGLVAAYLHLPLISVASALPIECDPGMAPPWLSWKYDTGSEAIKRRRVAERISAWLLRRHRAVIHEWAHRFGLSPRHSLEDCVSLQCCVSQTVPGFDFPRPSTSPISAVGPLRAAADYAELPPLDPPMDPDRPIVYASLGTLQGHRLSIFQRIARACRRLNVQLMVVHCGGLTSHQAATIEATWVRDHIPQRAMLECCDVCISHGGLNTVLDALALGVPVLALPMMYDQPGVAARLVHHQLGLRLSPRNLSVARVQEAIETLLNDSGYRRRAGTMRNEIETAGGTPRAVALIEDLLNDRQNAACSALY